MSLSALSLALYFCWIDNLAYTKLVFAGENLLSVALKAVIKLCFLCPSHIFTSSLAHSFKPMSTSGTENESATSASRKHTISSALQLGPRKKPCVVLLRFEIPQQ